MILGKNQNTQYKIFKINNDLIEDPQIIANKFNEYYSCASNAIKNNLPQSNHSFEEYLVPRDIGMMNWDLTNVHEVKRIVNKLNNVKAGSDKIPIKVIKNNIDILCPILTHLCNLSLSTGTFPTIHKFGIITPLYKKYDKADI